MPVSLTMKEISRAGGSDLELDAAFVGELAGVAQQVEKALLELGAVGVKRAERRRTDDFETVRVRRRQRLDDRAHLLDQTGEIDLFEIEVHLAGLDLRQIEDVVDQAEEMPAGIADLGEVGQKLVLPLVLRGLVQHLAVADDRVQRRPQLVAHAGEEGRFVLARHFELLVEIAELLRRPVDVGRQRAQFVAIADRHALGEVAGRDLAAASRRSRGSVRSATTRSCGRGSAPGRWRRARKR